MATVLSQHIKEIYWKDLLHKTGNVPVLQIMGGLELG